MKKNALIGFIALIFIALIAASTSYAASPSFKYTETFVDKLVKAPWGYEVVGTGKITINAAILLNTSTINGDTLLSIFFEDFQFEEQLKNASITGGYFDPKKRKARFVYSDVYYDYLTDQEKTVNNYLIVDVTWSSKTQLTIKVTCLTSPYDIQFPVIAYYYVGDYETRSIADDQELVDALISIDDFVVGFNDMNLMGSLKYKEAKKGKYDLFDTWNISLKASGIGTVLE